MFGHEIEGENQLLELPTGKLLPQRFISDVGGGGNIEHQIKKKPNCWNF